MLLQTNSYIVPSDKREEHARLIRRFRVVLARLGCDQYEVYEQVSADFVPLKGSSRFVQMMRFRDRQHQQRVQAAERVDRTAQDLVREFCQLINLDYQREHSLFAVGFYSGLVTGDGTEQTPEPVNAAEATPSDAPAVESRDFTTADQDASAQQRAAAALEPPVSAPPPPEAPASPQ